MRILTISDVIVPHLNPPLDRSRFRGIDLVLSCGDLPPEYLSSIVNALDVPLYYVRGNHDIRYADKQPEGCLNLHGRLVRFKGLNLLGLEGSHWYNGGPIQYTERQMRAVVRRLRPSIWWRGGVDIVAAHAPPRHMGDGRDLCHRGFDSFRFLIERYAPLYFVHGHIHAHFESRDQRVTAAGRTRVINTYGYHLLEIPD